MMSKSRERTRGQDTLVQSRPDPVLVTYALVLFLLTTSILVHPVHGDFSSTATFMAKETSQRFKAAVEKVARLGFTGRQQGQQQQQQQQQQQHQQQPQQPQPPPPPQQQHQQHHLQHANLVIDTAAFYAQEASEKMKHGVTKVVNQFGSPLFKPHKHTHQHQPQPQHTQLLKLLTDATDNAVPLFVALFVVGMTIFKRYRLHHLRQRVYSKGLAAAVLEEKERSQKLEALRVRTKHNATAENLTLVAFEAAKRHFVTTRRDSRVQLGTRFDELNQQREKLAQFSFKDKIRKEFEVLIAVAGSENPTKLLQSATASVYKDYNQLRVAIFERQKDYLHHLEEQLCEDDSESARLLATKLEQAEQEITAVVNEVNALQELEQHKNILTLARNKHVDQVCEDTLQLIATSTTQTHFLLLCEVATVVLISLATVWWSSSSSFATQQGVHDDDGWCSMIFADSRFSWLLPGVVNTIQSLCSVLETIQFGFSRVLVWVVLIAAQIVFAAAGVPKVGMGFSVVVGCYMLRTHLVKFLLRSYWVVPPLCVTYLTNVAMKILRVSQRDRALNIIQNSKLEPNDLCKIDQTFEVAVLGVDVMPPLISAIIPCALYAWMAFGTAKMTLLK